MGEAGNQEAASNMLARGREGGKSFHAVLAATPAGTESLPGVADAGPQLRRGDWEQEACVHQMLTQHRFRRLRTLVW